jgi:hypothetical protein
MACFIAPLVEAIAVTAIRKSGLKGNSPYLQHLPDLEKMLWGGTLMLIVDHIINGELMWRFPFFSALETSGGFTTMLHEMLTVGVPMSLALTVAWVIWVAVKEHGLRAYSTK